MKYDCPLRPRRKEPVAKPAIAKESPDTECLVPQREDTKRVALFTKSFELQGRLPHEKCLLGTV